MADEVNKTGERNYNSVVDDNAAGEGNINATVNSTDEVPETVADDSGPDHETREKNFNLTSDLTSRSETSGQSSSRSGHEDCTGQNVSTSVALSMHDCSDQDAIEEVSYDNGESSGHCVPITVNLSEQDCLDEDDVEVPADNGNSKSKHGFANAAIDGTDSDDSSQIRNVVIDIETSRIQVIEEEPARNLRPCLRILSDYSNKNVTFRVPTDPFDFPPIASTFLGGVKWWYPQATKWSFRMKSVNRERYLNNKMYTDYMYLMPDNKVYWRFIKLQFTLLLGFLISCGELLSYRTFHGSFLDTVPTSKFWKKVVIISTWFFNIWLVIAHSAYPRLRKTVVNILSNPKRIPKLPHNGPSRFIYPYPGREENIETTEPLPSVEDLEKALQEESIDDVDL